MTSKNLGETLMYLGALDDLAEAIELGKGVDLSKVGHNIRICVRELKWRLDLGTSSTIFEAIRKTSD